MADVDGFELVRQMMTCYGDPRDSNPWEWRPDICEFIGAIVETAARCPEDSTFLDLGCDRGTSTAALAGAPNAKKVWAVDPYMQYSQSAFFAHGHEAAHKFMVEEIVPRYKNLEFLRLTSVAASKFIADASLDLIVIDADHTYEHVKEDITIWRPKMKPGAIMMGHDYCDMWPGVKQAIDETLGAPDKVFPSTHWMKRL